MKQLTKLKVLRIDRAKWRTGSESKNTTGKGDTQLLNDKGYMCCLGFYCNQTGIPKTKLLDVPTPDGISIVGATLDVPLLTENGVETKTCSKAMSINDKGNIAAQKREDMLKELFKDVGVKVVITGKYKNNPIVDD